MCQRSIFFAWRGYVWYPRGDYELLFTIYTYPMLLNKVSPRIFKLALGLSLIGLLVMAFAPAQPAKGFIVGKVGAPISREVKAQLAQAYKAQYGKNAEIKRIEVLKYEGKNYLVFQSGGEGSPTLAIELKTRNDKWGFGANAAKNTCAGNPCSWCYFTSTSGCVCNTEGSCNHTVELGIDQKMAEVLGI